MKPSAFRFYFRPASRPVGQLSRHQGALIQTLTREVHPVAAAGLRFHEQVQRSAGGLEARTERGLPCPWVVDGDDMNVLFEE